VQSIVSQVLLSGSQAFPDSQVVVLQLNGIGSLQPVRVIEPGPQCVAQKPGARVQSVALSSHW
jgi:hypothetical protein